MSTSLLGRRTDKSSRPQTPSACPHLPPPPSPPPPSSTSSSKTSQIISPPPECSLRICPAPVPTLFPHPLCPGHAQSPSSHRDPRRWVNARDRGGFWRASHLQVQSMETPSKLPSPGLSCLLSQPQLQGPPPHLYQTLTVPQVFTASFLCSWHMALCLDPVSPFIPCSWFLPLFL